MTEVIIKVVIFSASSGRLRVFLSQNRLPHGKITGCVPLDQEAENIFQSCGLQRRGGYMEQLYTFSSQKNNYERVSLVYYFLLPNLSSKAHLQGSFVDSRKSGIFSIEDDNIVNYAIQRLCWKIEYTNVVYSLLPKEFTFSELQTVYEAILCRPLDKRNFRKKISGLNLICSTKHKKRVGAVRPAEMFTFRKRKLTYVEVL